jgi:hypothetical protein
VRESLRSTSARVLGIADHVWSLSELIDAALAQVPPDLGRLYKKPTLSVIDGGKKYEIFIQKQPYNFVAWMHSSIFWSAISHCWG